jgi:hypothetical protein
MNLDLFDNFAPHVGEMHGTASAVSSTLSDASKKRPRSEEETVQHQASNGMSNYSLLLFLCFPKHLFRI